MAPLRLSNGMQVEIRQATSAADLARVGGSFVRFKDHLPARGDLAAQAEAMKQVAETLAPFVNGVDVAQLADHLTAYPRDMQIIAARVVGSNTGTPRGKPRL